jgi:hypothetical protein
MSDTLDRLQSMLVDQIGKRPVEIDLDTPLQSIGFDEADLEELKVLIEESFKLSISAIEEEHPEIDVDSCAHNLKELTPRQLTKQCFDGDRRSVPNPRPEIALNEFVVAKRT